MVERRNVPGLAEPPGYKHLAMARGTTLVFTAGQVPLDAAGRVVEPGDLIAQTHRVVENLTETLAEAGARPEDVVKTTVYVAGDPAALVAAWQAFQEHAPAGLASAPSTLLGVTHLGYQGQLVEIEAVAVLDR
jgi:enamine deaminase RidA (YjgF/YER057c/UK114 family)